MNEDKKTAVMMAFVIVILLLALFGGGTMTGAMLSGGMMGSGAIGGISWMWIPSLLVAALAALFVWIIFGDNK